MWCQRPCSCAMSATAAIGSTAPVPVVPIALVTIAGCSPAARSRAIASRSASGRSAKASSTSTCRTCAKPAIFAPRSTDECACEEP